MLVEFYHTSRFQGVLARDFREIVAGFMKKRLGLGFDLRLPRDSIGVDCEGLRLRVLCGRARFD